jgi:hypothetical protein
LALTIILLPRSSAAMQRHRPNRPRGSRCGWEQREDNAAAALGWQRRGDDRAQSDGDPALDFERNWQQS